jgi:hypothetical protein
VKSKISRLLLIVFLFGLALFVKCYSSTITTSLFHHHIDILNQICQIQTNQSLEFYLGRVEEIVFGPFFMVMTGIAFLIFAASFLEKSNSKIFGLAVFLYFIATKFDIIFWPPYGDSASGPFVEAWWLYKNHFDYVGLMHQLNFVEGGPRTYVYSIYPTFIALLWTLIPNIKIFLLVNHLFVFLFSAVTITFFRRILLKCYDNVTALLASLVVLALPLFQSQAEQINMEMPMVMFAIVSIYYLIEKRLGLACMFAALAALVKGVGVSIPMTVVAVGIYLFFFHPQTRHQKKILFWTILSLISFCTIFYLNHTIIKEEGAQSLVGYLQGWKEMRLLPAPYLFIGSFVTFLVILVAKMRPSKKGFIEIVADYYVPLVMFICCAAWFVVFLNSSGQMCRYRLLLAPFLLFGVFYCLEKFVPIKKLIHLILVVGVFIGLLNSYGIFFKPHPLSIHSVLERTLEYRNDLKLQMKLAKELQDHFKKFVIGAQFTIAQILFIPELGFVRDRLDVMIYEFPCNYGIKTFRGLQNEDILKTIWVGYKTPDQTLPGYPVSPRDKVIKVLECGDKSVTLFMGGEYIQQRWLAIVAHYLLNKGH